MELEYKNLLGKEWIMNQQDCFTLVRDFFIQNFEIEIPNFARPQDWNTDKLDLVRTLYPKTGFEIITDVWGDLRPADVLACSIHSKNVNHLAIYIGDNELLHHRYGVNSCVETLRPFWRMSTLYVLRHPDVPDLRPELPDVNLEDLIRARFRL
jgi:cell wall-associated NlpC family hydrolase